MSDDLTAAVRAALEETARQGRGMVRLYAANGWVHLDDVAARVAAALDEFGLLQYERGAGLRTTTRDEALAAVLRALRGEP